LDFNGLATGKVSPAEIFDSLLSPILGEMTDGVIGRGGSGNEGGSTDYV
jgi:hypothetical protein